MKTTNIIGGGSARASFHLRAWDITQQWVRTPAQASLETLRTRKLVLMTLCGALVSTVSLAQTESTARIKIWSNESPAICQNYAMLLNQTPSKEPLPVCRNQLNQLPGATPLEWVELDPLRNLELLYKLEWLLRGQIKPEPEPEFNAWLKQFQRRAKHRATLPTIKQVRVSIEPDQAPQLVYSYETAGPSCSAKKLAAWGKDRSFGPFILLHNERAQDHNWSISLGYPFMYGKRLNMFSSYLSDKTHFVEWAASVRNFEAEKREAPSGDGYTTISVCRFSDTKIFYPPPKQ